MADGALPKLPDPRDSFNYVADGYTRMYVAATKCRNDKTDERGWYIQIGTMGTWISDSDADKLGRTLLFEKDGTNA